MGNDCFTVKIVNGRPFFGPHKAVLEGKAASCPQCEKYKDCWDRLKDEVHLLMVISDKIEGLERAAENLKRGNASLKRQRASHSIRR